MRTLTIRKPTRQLKEGNWMKLGMVVCLTLAAVAALTTKLEK